MAKIQEVNGQFSITLPKELIEVKGWGKGKVIFFGFDSDGNIVLKEKSKNN